MEQQWRKRVLWCGNTLSVVLPRVMPLGHWMSVATRTCLSTPFIPDFSILAGSPQSDQYRNLRYKHKQRCRSTVAIEITGFDPAATFHPPGQRIHSDRCRLFEAFAEQKFLLGSVEVGYRNSFGAEIRPVDVFIDPVDGDANGSLDVVNHFIVGADVPAFVQHSAVRKQTLLHWNIS